jgi:hypothetical protein
MIDHKNKLIFVHLEKTGGTSIEKVFTGLDWWWVGTFPLLTDKYKYDNGNIKHLSYNMSKILFSNFFNDYRKFIIVRHPYNLFVSKYFHFNRNSKTNKITKEDILKLIRNSNSRWRINKLHEFTGKKEDYDFIIKFENLSNDYEKMCKEFNINIDNYKLIHAYKSSYNKQKDYLTDEAKKTIKEYTKEYAKIFNYKL